MIDGKGKKLLRWEGCIEAEVAEGVSAWVNHCLVRLRIVKVSKRTAIVTGGLRMLPIAWSYTQGRAVAIEVWRYCVWLQAT